MADSSFTLPLGDGLARGQTPQVEAKVLPVGGTVFSSTNVLQANGSISTGWVDTSGYGSLLYVLRSDVPSATGGIVVDYSYDGVTVLPGGLGSNYMQADIGQLFQSALVPKGQYTRITYTNGSSPQGNFLFEVKLSTTLIQPTESSINKNLTATNLAMVTKSDIELNNGLGVYDEVYRTGNAMNVIPPSATAATVTTLTTLATATTILTANSTRKGAIFFSVSGTILIKLGSGASTTNFTTRLVTNSYYEMPQPVYTGVITAIGAGTLNVTEIS